MATLPFPPAAVASSADKLVVASGSTLHVVAGSSSSSSPTAASAKEAATGLIREVAVSSDGKLAVSAGDDKALCVWDLGDTVTLRSKRHTVKRVADISFAPDNSIILTDKVGDVYRYPLEPREVAERPKGFILTADPALNPDADYLLGHVSVVSQHALSHDGKRIITADRDEHIRVSRLPSAYVIERYLFGSEGFVSAIHIPASRPAALVSGGGEPTLQIWDWEAGTLQSRVEVFPAVKPHRRVRPQARKIKGPANRKPANASTAAPSDDPASDAWYVAPEGMMYPTGQGVCIEQIGSVEVGGATVVVFFAEGCAALHAFVLPISGDDNNNTPEIHTLPLTHPVLGFTRAPGTDAQLVVTLDASWGVAKDATEIDAARATQSLALVDVGPNGQLSAVSDSPLLSTLTTAISAAALQAPAAILSGLNLYPNLSLFPRWPGFEEDEELAGPWDEKASRDLDTMAPKHLGRLKAKGVDVQDLLPKKNKKRKKNKGGAVAAPAEESGTSTPAEEGGAVDVAGA